MESDSLTLDKSIWAAVRSFGAEISKRATVRLRTLFERADRCKPVSCAQSLGLTLCDSTFFVWRHLTAQIKNHEPFRVFLSSWAHVTWVIRYIRSTCAGLIRSTAPGDWAQLHKFLCVKLSPVSWSSWAHETCADRSVRPNNVESHPVALPDRSLATAPASAESRKSGIPPYISCEKSKREVLKHILKEAGEPSKP